MASQLLSYFFINFSQVTAGLGVKIKEYVHAWFLLRVSHASFFSFHFLPFSIYFPKLTIFTTVFYVSTRLSRRAKSLRSLERYRVEDW